jgi:hypothetical protein
LRVEYLLISGQATILYGAATFSEDVDLWVLPTEENLERFVSALRSVAATHYKLTPPLTVENLERGHGFHFVLPGGPSGDVYLDVMGRPPRVGSFESAASIARVFDTDFGRVRTIGIQDLVELKKTQRPEDYPIIARLALAFLAEREPVVRADLSWALDNWRFRDLLGSSEACVPRSFPRSAFGGAAASRRPGNARSRRAFSSRGGRARWLPRRQEL